MLRCVANQKRDVGKPVHSLRHSVVTNLTRQGLPPLRSTAATRHRSGDTLLAYVQEVEYVADPVEEYVNYGGTQ